MSTDPNSPVPRRRPRTWQLVVAWGALAVGLLAGVGIILWPPGGDSPQAGPAEDAAPDPAVVTVTAFGAVPDDGRDDGAAVQRAFDAARPGQRVLLPPGEYQHATALRLAVPGVIVSGPDAVLIATDATDSTVAVAADDITVEGLTVRVPTATERIPGKPRSGFWLAGARGTVLHEVTVDGTAAAGIVVDGATDFRIDRAIVRNTRADGIHVTGAARAGVIDHPEVSGTGDDGVSVVSYLRDADVVRDIEVLAPKVTDQRRGRALSVVGGIGVRFTDIDVQASAAAAVYVAVEGEPFRTAEVRDVVVSGGTIHGANTDAAADHGAITVFLGTADAVVNGVVLTDIDISDTRAEAGASVQVKSRAGAMPLGLDFTGVRVRGGPAEEFGGNVPLTAYRVG